jgi:hypothetical protein
MGCKRNWNRRLLNVAKISHWLKIKILETPSPTQAIEAAFDARYAAR